MNTLLPARIFVLCSVVCARNEFVSSLLRVMRLPIKLMVTIVSAKAKSKYHLFGGSYCAVIGRCMEWSSVGGVVLVLKLSNMLLYIKNSFRKVFSYFSK